MSIHTLPIVGAKFRPPALCVLSSLGSQCRLLVRREPTNQYDPNALQVLVLPGSFSDATINKLRVELPNWGFSFDDVASLDEIHLGYVPRERAAEIAPQFDEASVGETLGVLTFNAEGAPRVQFSVRDKGD